MGSEDLSRQLHSILGHFHLSALRVAKPQDKSLGWWGVQEREADPQEGRGQNRQIHSKFKAVF
jgi:hypothetical protein